MLNPLQVIEFMRKMVKRYPHAHFDFHAHNDYDLAVSNVLAAVLSGCKGLHTTINGLGERAGNAPLASVQAILKDHFSAVTNIDESRLNDVSRVVESYSGIVIPANKPIVGENVFTQVAGVHADGDNKSNLYCNDLLPERFGRKREYALGKNSGKANIRKNLEDLGLELDEDAMRKVTERIIELGDKKGTGDAGRFAVHRFRCFETRHDGRAGESEKLHREPCLRTETDGYVENRNQRQGV